MDMSIYSAVSGGLQQAIQMARGLLDLKVETETAFRINALVGQLGDVTGKFLAAQEAHLACKESAMELEKEITRMKAFESEKQRYALRQLGDDAFAYALKAEAAGEEPPHNLCARCYGQSQKAILQFARYESRFKVLVCPSCKAEVRVPHGIPDSPVSSGGRGDRLRGF